MANARPRDSCRETFKTVEIMKFYSCFIYIYIYIPFIHKHLFITNRVTHKYRNWSNNNLHLPTINLPNFSKGAYITGVKIFNHLPQ